MKEIPVVPDKKGGSHDFDDATLVELYKEQMAYCRHNENQRALMTNIIIVISTIILGILFQDGKLMNNLPLALCLTIMGSFGVVFSRKHYERWSFHDKMADRYREIMEERYSILDIKRKELQYQQRKEYSIIYELNLNALWVTMPLLIGILGAVLTALIIKG